MLFFFFFFIGVFAHFGPCSSVAFFFYSEKGKKKSYYLPSICLLG